MLFCAKDACQSLGLNNSSQAISVLDDDEKGVIIADTLGGRQRMAAVTESGLYVLIFQSRKPNARAFRRWITGEVLPSIRRTGFYKTDRKGLKCGTADADVRRMLAVIDSFLMVGDKKSVADEIGVSQASIVRVIKGEMHSVRILSALYDRAMTNSRRLNGNPYLSPERAIERLLNPKTK